MRTYQVPAGTCNPFIITYIAHMLTFQCLFLWFDSRSCIWLHHYYQLYRLNQHWNKACFLKERKSKCSVHVSSHYHWLKKNCSTMRIQRNNVLSPLYLSWRQLKIELWDAHISTAVDSQTAKVWFFQIFLHEQKHFWLKKWKRKHTLLLHWERFRL